MVGISDATPPSRARSAPSRPPDASYPSTRYRCALEAPIDIKTLHEALAALPAYDLDADVLAATAALLLEKGQLVVFNGGDVLAPLGDESDTCWLIVLGSVDEWSLQRRLAVRTAGQFTGEISVLSQALQSVEIQAREEGVAVALDGDFIRDLSAWPLPFASAWLGQVAQHALAWSNDADMSISTITEQNYPFTNPMIFPGPYVAQGAELIYIPCKLDAGGLSGCLAPGVTPVLFFWICIARYHGGVGLGNTLEDDLAFYDEVVVMVPSLIGLTPALYFPWIYVGSAAAMTAGREVFGYPKMLYNATLDDRDDLGFTGQSRCVLRKNGADVMTALWKDLAWGDVDAEDRARLVQMVFDPHEKGGDKAQDMDRMARNDTPDELTARVQRMAQDDEATVNVGSWKRSFDPSTALPGPGPVVWEPSQFQIDGVAGSLAQVTDVESLNLIAISELVATSEFLLPGAELLIPFGFRCTVDFGLLPDKMLKDYLTNPPTRPSERRKLNWGPDAWAPSDDGSTVHTRVGVDVEDDG